MAFVTACTPSPVGPSSRGVATRGVVDSAHRRRRYESLSGRSAFKKVFRTGSRRRVGAVTVIRGASLQKGLPLVGVVAGKKIGNAVRRNRAKRRIRAALETVSLRDGATYVVVASPEAVHVDFETLTADLKEAMKEDK